MRGRVLEVAVEAGVVRGRATGSGDAVYAVELTRRAGVLQWRCDCPMGERGELCKHLVAAALEALHGQEGDEENGESPIRTYLESLDHGALVDLLLEQAGRDDALATRLEGAALAGPETDADRLRLFVEEALDPGRFIGWEDVSDYLDEAEAVEPLLERVEARDPAMAADLAANALRAGFSGVDWVDDSGGQMGELLGRIGERLEQALRVSGAAGAELAETLFPLLRDQPFPVLKVERFRDPLGEPGLRRLEACAREARTSPAGTEAGPGLRELQEIQAAAARARGDVDGLIAALTGGPAVPGAHLRIARALEGAGRGEEAIEWAEAGLSGKEAGWPDRTLVEWLVAAYGRSGRHQQALDLAWTHFVRAAQLASYQVLKQAAEAAGRVADWRGRALDWLREQAGGELSGQRAGSVLVAIHLWEGQSAQALTACRELGADRQRRQELAEALEGSDPGAAGDLFADLVEGIIEHRGNRAYDDAVALLGRIAALWSRAGREADTADLLAAIRQRHGRKRNLMSRLDAAFGAVR